MLYSHSALYTYLIKTEVIYRQGRLFGDGLSVYGIWLTIPVFLSNAVGLFTA